LWNIIKENEEQECISFIVPEKCVVSQAPKCSISVLGESSQDFEGEMSLHPPSAPKRKRRGNAPLVESEVRRSPRILEKMRDLRIILFAKIRTVCHVLLLLLILSLKLLKTWQPLSIRWRRKT
jgi:hypothetical protein